MQLRFAALVLALAVCALPASAQDAAVDSFPLHQANIDQLAGQLVDKGYLAAGDKVFVAPPGGDEEQVFFHDMLVGGLLKRGVATVVRQEAAKKALYYTWVRQRGESLQIHAFDINGRPDTALKIRNRLVCRVVDLGTGAVVASDLLLSDTRPFADLAFTAAATASAGLGAKIAESAWEPKELHGLGLTVSWLAGSGLSYRHWWQNGFGAQAAAVPLISMQDGKLSGLANVGLQGMIPVVHNRTFRIYGLLGYGLAFDRGFFYNQMVPVTDDKGYTTYVKSDSFRLDQGVAPGFGVDYMVTPNLAVYGAVAYTFSYSGTSDASGSLSLNPGFSPGGAVGTYFYF